MYINIYTVHNALLLEMKEMSIYTSHTYARCLQCNLQLYSIYPLEHYCRQLIAQRKHCWTAPETNDTGDARDTHQEVWRDRLKILQQLKQK